MLFRTPHRKKAAAIAAFCLFSCNLLPREALAFSIPAPIPGETQGIEIKGSTVLIKGLTNQVNKATINGRRVLIQPDGAFYQDIIIPLGETEIVVAVEAPEGQRAEYRKKITAKANHFFATGIADGTLNFSDASNAYQLHRDANNFEDGFQPHGKLSYYATGKLQGKYLFKSSLDTEKETGKGDLFIHIDPDDYYPIYGDNATVVYDVNSQGKFYGLFEWDKSGFVIGNYQTQIGEDAGLLNYHRTLFGAKAHIESPRKTVYGDAYNKMDFFVAEAYQHRGHSELLASGGSLYYLRHRNIVEGSEQVKIQIRDKFSGRIIQEIPQLHNADYEMKYEEGRITFNRPVMQTAASDTFLSNSVLEGNAVYVVANYEYDDQDAFIVVPQDLGDTTGGVRVSQHLGDHVRGGFTYVQEQQEQSRDLRHLGGDFTLKLGNFTKVNFEAARSLAGSSPSFISYNGGYDFSSYSIDNNDEGMAYRMEANSTLGEYLGQGKEFLDVSAYWQRIDHGFSAADSLFEAGSEKYGIDLAHKIDGNDRARVFYEQGRLEKNAENALLENQLQASKVDHLLGQWIHELNQWTFATGYSFQQDQSPLDAVDDGVTRGTNHLIGERVQYEIDSKTSAWVAQQIGLNHINESFTSLGASRQLTDSVAVHAQAGAGPLGNSVSAGFNQQVDRFSTRYVNYSELNSVLVGRSSISSFGMNSQVSEKATLRRERQFVASDLRGHYRQEVVGYLHQITTELAFDGTVQRRDERYQPTLTGSSARDAYTGACRYVKPDVLKAGSRAEYRVNSDNLWQVFIDTQAEWKVTQDFFLYGEHEMLEVRGAESHIDKKQIALAYRPVAFDWLNGLLKYIRYVTDRPQNLFSADGGFSENESDSHLFAGEVAIDLPFKVQYVKKVALLDKEIVAVNPTGTIQTPDDIRAFLWINRLNYHLTNRVDAALEYRRLHQRGATVRHTDSGFLFELTYQIVKHLAVGAGFNFTHFSDDLLTGNEGNARGFFLRLQGKY